MPGKEKGIHAVYTIHQGNGHDLIATSFSICAVHFFTNSSSVNLLAEALARFLAARRLGSESAFSYPSANPFEVVAWKPMAVSSCHIDTEIRAMKTYQSVRHQPR
jgi:hypothetical protein